MNTHVYSRTHNVWCVFTNTVSNFVFWKLYLVSMYVYRIFVLWVSKKFFEYLFQIALLSLNCACPFLSAAISYGHAENRDLFTTNLEIRLSK